MCVSWAPVKDDTCNADIIIVLYSPHIDVSCPCSDDSTIETIVQATIQL